MTTITAVHPTAATPHAPGRRIRDRTTAALRDVAYSIAALLWSVVAFSVLVAGVTATASTLVLAIGVVVWLGFALVLRATTWVDRRLAGWQRGESLSASYRRPPARGLVPVLKTVTGDPQTWRDMGWLGLTSIVGFTLGLTVVSAVGIGLAYVSMPVWYWAISEPGELHGFTDLGAVTIDTFGEAVAVSGAGAVLIPCALLLARGCATAHAALAARVLSPRARAKRAARAEPASAASRR